MSQFIAPITVILIRVGRLRKDGALWISLYGLIHVLGGPMATRGDEWSKVFLVNGHSLSTGQEEQRGRGDLQVFLPWAMKSSGIEW